MKLKWKWKIPHTVSERRTLCFSSYKNRKLKVKLWWVGTRKRKKDFLYRSSCPEGNFFDICLLFKCIMYWIHFQNIHTFIYQKTLLRTLFCRFSKSVESLRCILKCLSFYNCSSFLKKKKHEKYIVDSVRLIK